jgi:SMC interacting uncharacterized protein involved in chromosome segregation
MKKYILPIIIILLFGWLVVNKVDYYGLSDQFKATQDSLVAAVDSMQLEIAKDDSAIAILDKKDDSLQYVIDHQKAKVKTIIEYIEIEKSNVDSYSEAELVSSFNKRYPTDTITNPLPVAQPVLVSAAKDLVELDGVKQIIVLKDSSIATLESRVSNKDSVIAKFISKETNYKGIVDNQQTQIKDWKSQYNTLKIQNTKLKIQAKIGKIGAGLALAGLTFLLIK